MAGHARWRAVAETSDLVNVVGPRVRFMCLDVSDTHVVLGANTGSAYVFERQRAEGDTKEANLGDNSNANLNETRNKEGSLKFLTMISPTDAPAVEPREGTGDGANDDTQIPTPTITRRNITPALSKIKLHPSGTLCAVANANGVVQVLEFLTKFDGSRSSPGKVVVQVPHAHWGKECTWLEWSRCGTVLISGDDAGTIAVTDISYVKTDDAVDQDHVLYENASSNQTRHMTPAELLTTPAVSSILECGSCVVQCSFNQQGTMAVVSTLQACFVLSIKTGVRPRLGSKPREGLFGACFHGNAKSAVDTEGGTIDSNSSNHEWVIASRPGRRLWIAEVWVDDDGVTPVSRVAATLKPNLPAPSRAPGSSTANPKKPKKFEFGEVHELGKVCALVHSDRALAVVDVPGGTLLEWFPLAGEPGGFGVAAGIRAVSTHENKAFVLAEQSEQGGGGVWCLEVPSTPHALVCAVADAAALDGSSGSVTRALVLATRVRVVETRMLEDARRVLQEACELQGTSTTETQKEDVAEIEHALEAYEAFCESSDAPPPPPRPCPTERIAEDAVEASPPPSAPPFSPPVVLPPPEIPAPAPTVVPIPKVPSRGGLARGGRASPAPGGEGDADEKQNEYPPADASTKFFFYNPRSGDTSAVPLNTGADGETDKEPKTMKASVIDAIAVAQNASEEKSSSNTFESDNLDQEVDPETAAETAAARARVEEDLEDAVFALETLMKSEEDEIADDDEKRKFNHWSEYPNWELKGDSPSVDELTLSGLTLNTLASSSADRRRDVQRRQRQDHIACAAAARFNLAHAQRSLDAGELVPLLRVWRAARDAHILAPVLDDSFDVFEDIDEVPASLTEAAESALAAVDNALRRVEQRLELACAELGLFGDEEVSATKTEVEFGVFAKQAVAEREVRFADATRVVFVDTTEYTTDANFESEIPDSDSVSIEERAVELVSGGITGAPQSDKDVASASRRRRATLKAMPAELARQATTEAMKVLLRDIVSAAEEETRALNFASATPSKVKDGDALVRRARSKGASAKRALESICEACCATETVGADVALLCLEKATTGDPTLASLMSASSMASRVGEAFADAVVSLSLDLSSASVERLKRERAAAQTLVPLEQHLVSPPPAAIGKFPQLRAVLHAECAFAKDQGNDTALRALPFVRQENNKWRLAFESQRSTPIAPFLEENGDWGALVEFDKGRCARCDLEVHHVVPSGSAQLVTFPCGHTFHVTCVPEDACVECLRLKGKEGRLCDLETRESVAVNAELAHMLASVVK